MTRGVGITVKCQSVRKLYSWGSLVIVYVPEIWPVCNPVSYKFSLKYMYMFGLFGPFLFHTILYLPCFHPIDSDCISPLSIGSTVPE